MKEFRYGGPTMRIAITGATGDIGGGYLDSLGDQAAVNVLAREGSVISRPGVEFFSFRDGFTYDRSFLEKFVTADALVHCAALLNSDQYTLEEVFAVNALLTALLAHLAQANGEAKIVYLSTEMVYTIRKTPELIALERKFLTFCRGFFTATAQRYNLRHAARAFIKQNATFAFDRYNNYALAKYLGEVIVGSVPGAAIVRISNAYGPGYSNPRLLARMMRGRLMGHTVTYPNEERDFVYSEDINRLITTVIEQDLKGVIDCRSQQATHTRDAARMILRATPTAYGELISTSHTQKQGGASSISPAPTSLSDIFACTSFESGFGATLRWHKKQTYHQMKDSRSLQDFLHSDEHIEQMLHGSSAAHLCVVRCPDGTKKVRKIAIYDGVEGNGIAKVASEIAYYQYISKHKPQLAALYPCLLEAHANETFSSETIEYLEGRNFYQAIHDNDLTDTGSRAKVVEFIDTLSRVALSGCTPAARPYADLDAYYIERSLSRLHSANDLLTIRDDLMINGERYIAPHLILSQLTVDKKLRDILKPRTQAFCFHGDLTFLNTVFERPSQTIRLIDPRGYIGQWDPLYDYGKLLFTLAGFGELIVGNAAIVSRGRDETFELHLEHISPVSRYLQDEFFSILAADETFRTTIIPQEQHWRERLLLAVATHFLEDIPFRLYTDSTTTTALASYVIGTYYLNKVYEEIQK